MFLEICLAQSKKVLYFLSAHQLPRQEQEDGKTKNVKKKKKETHVKVNAFLLEVL